MSHALANVYLHFVWSTKDRYPYIAKNIKTELYRYICGIARNQDSPIISINGMPDHIHFLTKLHKELSMTFLVQQIKTHSSRFVRRKFSMMQDFTWQKGFGVFSVSESVVPKVVAYIKNQEEHHKRMSFYDEYQALLRKHNLAFDAKNIFK